MTINELLKAVKSELSARKLKQPSNRENAIERVADYIRSDDRYISSDKTLALPKNANSLKKGYERYKGRTLSDSEKSVIKQMYAVYNTVLNNTKQPTRDNALPNESDMPIRNKPLIYIDLFAGKWVETKTGHECFNFELNVENKKYYGYCPPGKNISLQKLGAKRGASFIDGVLVIYTKRRSKDDSNREIIAFIDNARVYKEKITDIKLKRTIIEDKKTVHCSYSIVSDSIYDLRSSPNKHIIHLNGRNIFRNQRCYKGDHPQIDKSVLAYLENYLKHTELEDDSTFQNQVFEEEEYSSYLERDNSKNKPEYNRANGSKSVVKNPKVSKSALFLSGFKCAVDSSHKTFISSKGVQYMEGHHLIPCTCSNASRIWKQRKRNIDCKENIVCLCPTCHRRVHFGSNEEKKSILHTLYKHQIKKLKSVGLELSFDDLLDLYLK